MATNTQIRANRENAAHSTGPKTETGKRISSHNALKTGLTGRTVVLPTDDLAAYQAHLARVDARYQPATDEETLHVQTIAHIEWRLLRIPTLETGLLALGRKRFAETHTEETDHDLRAILIEAEVALAFQKPLANLALQESRLQRQHERERAKLERLQAPRKAETARLQQEAARFYLHCRDTHQSFPLKDLHSFGFEFSLADIQHTATHWEAHRNIPHWPTIHAHYALQDLQQAA